MRRELLYKIILVNIFSLLLVLPAASQTNEECIECHSEMEMEFKNAFGYDVTASFNADEFSNSIHGEVEVACIDCHNTIEEIPHEDELPVVDCSMCHDSASEDYMNSLHGYAYSQNVDNSPTCISCHGKHNILASDNENSHSNQKNISKTCAVCHGENGLKRQEGILSIKTVEIYEQSVHGQNIAGGDGEAATCTSCHGGHTIKGSLDNESTVNRQNIPETCSQCHMQEYEEYTRSIHGLALAAGIKDTPICTDCHGEHSIESHLAVGSKTSKSQQSAKICADCHEDEMMIRKYGLPTETFATYKDSYHGLAVSDGSQIAASCTDCHGVHEILTSLDEASTIHPNNLVETCSGCHPDADEAFSASYTHQMQREDTNIVDYYVKTFYIFLIVSVIGFMLLHNIMIWIRAIILKFRETKKLKVVQRFNKQVMIQHILTAVSFFALVITGFALKYPEAGWVVMLKSVGLTEASRSYLHRVSAVVMIIGSLYHLFYAIFTKYGRAELKHIMLRWKDIKDMYLNFKYLLGREEHPPGYGKYGYPEKLEYWALIWGTIVMIATGFLLWFPTAGMKFLPDWALKVSETIHFYEAWLAFLAILVWHFFFVFFAPDEFPMNTSMFSGKMSKEEADHKFPEWDTSNGDKK